MYTVEVEYISLASAIQNTILLKHLTLQSLMATDGAGDLFMDNQSTCAMLSKPFGTKQRKFIDLEHNYIQSQIQDDNTRVRHVSAAHQRTDIFTKPLSDLNLS